MAGCPLVTKLVFSFELSARREKFAARLWARRRVADVAVSTGSNFSTVALGGAVGEVRRESAAADQRRGP